MAHTAGRESGARIMTDERTLISFLDAASDDTYGIAELWSITRGEGVTEDEARRRTRDSLLDLERRGYIRFLLEHTPGTWTEPSVFQRPVVQEAVQEVEQATAKTAVTLNNSQVGQLIGWGRSQTGQAVAQTQAVTQSLTSGRVQELINQGLTRSWVEKMSSVYASEIEEGNDAVNMLLAPRLEVLQTILRLWPEN